MMTVNEKCLYSGFSNNCCDKMAKEHVLQESIGGTLKSTEILCDNCNHYFGDKFDFQLKMFYLKIILNAALDLPNGLSKSEYRIKQKDGVELVLSAGNTVSFRGIRYLDGERAILATPEHEVTVIEKIFNKRHGTVGKIKTQEMPISNRYQTIDYPKKDYYQTHRAAVKSSLNFIRYFELKGKFPGPINWDALGSAKRFVFDNNDGFYFGRNKVPFIDIQSLARKWEIKNELSHHFIVSNDSKAGKAYVFLSIFNSFSWYFEVYGMFRESQSFTFVYSKVFLPNKQSREKVYRKALVTEKMERDIRFVVTKDSFRFSANKFEESMENVHSQSTLHSDLYHSSILKSTIRTIGLNFKGQKNKADLVIKELISNRYSGSVHLKEVLKFTEIYIGKNKIGNPRKTLSYYRSLLKKIVKKYGYPVLKSFQSVQT
jgi:hypothetical protein